MDNPSTKHKKPFFAERFLFVSGSISEKGEMAMSSLFELDIQNCKGVGPQRAKLFRKLGVPTVGDLLRLYPRAYEDWSQHCLIRDTTLNEVAVVKATVLRRPTEHRVKGGKLLYKTTVTDGDSDMALTFFNNKYIPTLLREGETLSLIHI